MRENMCKCSAIPVHFLARLLVLPVAYSLALLSSVGNIISLMSPAASFR